MPTGRIGRATRAREGRRNRAPRGGFPIRRWRPRPVAAKAAISLNFRVYLTQQRAVATYDASEKLRGSIEILRGGFRIHPPGAHGKPLSTSRVAHAGPLGTRP